MDYFTLTIIGLLIFPSVLSTRNGKLLQSPSKETMERTCPCLPVAVCQQHQGTNSNAEFLGLIPVCEELSFVRCCGAPPLKKVSFPAELIRTSRVDYTSDTSAETSHQEKKSYKESLVRKLYDTRGLKKDVLHKVKGKARSKRDTEQVLAHEFKDEMGITVETATHSSYEKTEGEMRKYDIPTDSEKMFGGEVTDPILAVSSTDAPRTEVPETEKPGQESSTESNFALHFDILDPNPKESVTSPKTEVLEKADALPSEAEASMRSDMSGFSTTLSSASSEVEADITGGTEKTADKKAETPELLVHTTEHTIEKVFSVTPQATSFYSTTETEVTTDSNPIMTEKSVQVTTQNKSVSVSKTSFPIDFRKVKKTKYLDVKEQIESQVSVVYAASRDEDQNSTFTDDKDESQETDDLVKANSEIKLNLYNKIGSQITGDRHHIQRIPLKKRVKIYKKFKPSEEQALKELIYDSFRNKSSIFPNEFLPNVNNSTIYQKTKQNSDKERETNRISNVQSSSAKDGIENLEGSHSSRVQVFVLKPNSSESAHTLTLESGPSRFQILKKDPEGTLNRPHLRNPPFRERVSTIKPQTIVSSEPQATVSSEPSRPPNVSRGKIKYQGIIMKDAMQVSHTTKPSPKIKPSVEKELLDSSTVAPRTVAVAHSTKHNLKHPGLKPGMPVVTDSVRIDQQNSTLRGSNNQPISVNFNDQAAKQEKVGSKQEFLTDTQSIKKEGGVVSVSQTGIEKNHDQDRSRNESSVQIQGGEKEDKVVLQSNAEVEGSHHQGESQRAPLSHTENGENGQEVLLQSHGGMTGSNHQSGLKHEPLSNIQSDDKRQQVVQENQAGVKGNHGQGGLKPESSSDHTQSEGQNVELQSHAGVKGSHGQGGLKPESSSHTKSEGQNVELQSHAGVKGSHGQGGLKPESSSHTQSEGQKVELQSHAGVEGGHHEGGLKPESSSHTQSEGQKVELQSHAGVEGGHHEGGLKHEPIHQVQSIDKGEQILLQSHAGAKGSHHQGGLKHEPQHYAQSGEKGQQVSLPSHAGVEAGHHQDGLKHEFSASSQSSGQRGMNLPASNSEVEKRYLGGLRPGPSPFTQNRRNEKIGSPNHGTVHKQNHGRLQHESSSNPQGSEGMEVASESPAGVSKRIQGGPRREFSTRYQNTGAQSVGVTSSNVRIDRRNQSPLFQSYSAKKFTTITSPKNDGAEDAPDKTSSVEKNEQEISFAETNTHSLAVSLGEETSLNKHFFKPPAQFQSGFVPLRDLDSLNVGSSTPARPEKLQNYQSHSSAVLTNPLQNPQNPVYTNINKYFGHSSNLKPSQSLNENSLNELYKVTPQNVKVSGTKAEPAGKPLTQQSNPSHKAQISVTPNLVKEHYQVISQNLQLTNPQPEYIRRPAAQQLNSGTRFEIQSQPNQQYNQNPPNNFNTVHAQTTSKPTEAPSSNIIKKMPEFIMKQFLSIFSGQQQDPNEEANKIEAQTPESVQKPPPKSTGAVQQKLIAPVGGEAEVRQKVGGRKPQIQNIQDSAALLNFYEENGRQPVKTSKVGLTALEILKSQYQEKPQAQTTAQTQSEPQRQPQLLPQPQPHHLPQTEPQSPPQPQLQLQPQPQSQPRPRLRPQPQQTESGSVTAFDILQSHFKPQAESPSRSQPQHPQIQQQFQPEPEAQIKAKPQPQQTESPRVTVPANLQSHFLSQPEPHSLPQSRPRLRPRPRSQPRPRPEIQPQSQLETQAQVEPQSQVQAQRQQFESTTVTALNILQSHFQPQPQPQSEPQSRPRFQPRPRPQLQPQSHPELQAKLQPQPQALAQPQQSESASLTAQNILQSHFQPQAESPSRSQPQHPQIQQQFQPEPEAQIKAKPQTQQTESPRVTVPDNLQSHFLSQPEPHSLPQSRPQIQSGPRLRPRPRSQPRPRPQIQPQSQLETQAQVEPQSQVQAQRQQFESTTVTALNILQSHFQPQPQPQSEPQSEPQSRPRFQPRPRPQLQPQSHPELQAKPQPQPQALAQPQKSESTSLTAQDILQSQFQSQPSSEPLSRPLLQPRLQIKPQPQIEAGFHLHPQPEENPRLQEGSQTNDKAKTDINKTERVTVLGAMNTVEKSMSAESKPVRKHGKRPNSRRRLKGNRDSSKKPLSTTDNASLEVNRGTFEGAQLKENSRNPETSPEEYLNKFKLRHGGSAPSEAILMQHNGENYMTTENYPVSFQKRFEVPNNSPITSSIGNSPTSRLFEVPNKPAVPSTEASSRRRSHTPKRVEVPNSAPTFEVATSPIRNSPVPKRSEVPNSSPVAIGETSSTRSSPVPKRFAIPSRVPESAVRTPQISSSPVPKRFEVPNSFPVSAVRTSPVRRSPDPKRFEIPRRDPESAVTTPPIRSGPAPKQFEVPNSSPAVTEVETSLISSGPAPKRFEVPNSAPVTGVETSPISSGPAPKQFEVPNSAPVTGVETSPISSGPAPKQFEVPNSARVTGVETSPISSGPAPKRFEVPNSAPVTGVETSPISSGPAPERFEVPNSAPVTGVETSLMSSGPAPKRFEVPNSAPVTGVETSLISSGPAPKRFEVPNSAPVTGVETSLISSGPAPKRFEVPNSVPVTGVETSAISSGPGPKRFEVPNSAPVTGVEALPINNSTTPKRFKVKDFAQKSGIKALPGKTSTQKLDQASVDVQTRLLVQTPVSGDILSINQNSHAPLHSMLNPAPARENSDIEHQSSRKPTKQRGRNRYGTRVTSKVQDSTSERVVSTTESSISDVEQVTRFPSRKTRPGVTKSTDRRENLPSRRRQHIKNDPEKASESTSEATPQVGISRRRNFASAKPSADPENEMYIQAMRSIQQLLRAR